METERVQAKTNSRSIIPLVTFTQLGYTLFSDIMNSVTYFSIVLLSIGIYNKEQFLNN